MTVHNDKPAKPHERAASGGTGKAEQAEDTALSSLTAEDRDRLVMDAWEPSLLRKLLSAQNRLKRRS